LQSLAGEERIEALLAELSDTRALYQAKLKQEEVFLRANMVDEIVAQEHLLKALDARAPLGHARKKKQSSAADSSPKVDRPPPTQRCCAFVMPPADADQGTGSLKH